MQQQNCHTLIQAYITGWSMCRSCWSDISWSRNNCRLLGGTQPSGAGCCNDSWSKMWQNSPNYQAGYIKTNKLASFLFIILNLLPENIHRSVEELPLVGAHNCVPSWANKKPSSFSTNLNIFLAFHFLIRSPLRAWSPTKISFLNSECRPETALKGKVSCNVFPMSKLSTWSYLRPKLQSGHER